MCGVCSVEGSDGVSELFDTAVEPRDHGVIPHGRRVPHHTATAPTPTAPTAPTPLRTPGALTLVNQSAVQLRALADEVPAGRPVLHCPPPEHRELLSTVRFMGLLMATSLLGTVECCRAVCPQGHGASRTFSGSSALGRGLPGVWGASVAIRVGHV